VSHLCPIALRAWLADQLPSELSGAVRDTFCAAIRHYVEFPADAKRWVDIVFGPLHQRTPEAQAVIREAGEQFFAAAGIALQASAGEFNKAAQQIEEIAGRRGPALYLPLNAAITGETHGPELAPLLPLIPPAEVALRLASAQRLARA
jgi:glutamyl-tRNA synthetase